MRKAAAPRSGRLAHLASRERRFVLVDGGAGARLSMRLSACMGLRAVPSPRHAELLVLVEPVSSRLAPSVVELYRAMPRPRGVLVVGTAGRGELSDADLFRVEHVFLHAERVPDSLGVAQIATRMLAMPLRVDEAPCRPSIAPITIALPDTREREIATEPVVLSLGPVQPLTAGPLRLLLVADGEQTVSVTVEAGYAARNVAQTMSHAAWGEAAHLASLIDPLAPAMGRLAFVAALEKLRRDEPDECTRRRRSAMLAFERAQNHVAWLARFAELLGDRRLGDSAVRLDAALADASSASERASPPQRRSSSRDERSRHAPAHLDLSRWIEPALAELASLLERLPRNRALAMRTVGIGVLPLERLRAAGVTGPVLRASERHRGDVSSRLLTRIEQAAEDLREVAACPGALRPVYDEAHPDSPVPRGETEVSIEGPRGRIGLALTSDGTTLRGVEWRRPSAVLLGLLPELLANQKLADVEAIVASLDLAMAEADG